MACATVPYLASATLMRTAAAMEDERAWTVSASGFRDTSRISGSDPQMMLDILMTNKTAVLAQLAQYQGLLTAVAAHLQNENETALRDWLTHAQSEHRHYKKQGSGGAGERKRSNRHCPPVPLPPGSPAPPPLIKIDILTLFPDMFSGYFDESIMRRAQAMGQLAVQTHNIRDYAAGKHRVTDDPPFGGGGGMVLKPEPIFGAVEAIERADDTPVILLSPQGRPFTQAIAQELSHHPHLILLCGRYEGVDERVRQHLVTDEISIGDYVLTGGELAAMVLVDAITRLLPGVLGADGAADDDSHAMGLLEGAHYTKPAVFRDWTVPDVVRSGHAANIARWRREGALHRTWERRPEMLLTTVLTEEDKWFLQKLAEG